MRRVIIVLSFLAFLLSGMPRLRAEVGAPICAIDLVTLYLLIKTIKSPRLRYLGYARILTQLISIYLVFVVLGELKGGLVYHQWFESIYLLFRSYLAISLAYIVPRQVQTLNDLKVVLKGLCVGLLLSATFSVLYSFPFTRGLTEKVYAIKALAPDSDLVLEGNEVYSRNYDGNLRSRNLIGASTFSSGVMAVLWPLLFIAAPIFQRVESLWQKLTKAALVMLPLAIMTTYGRTAWLSVVLVCASLLLWGSKRGRATILFWILLAGLFFGQLGFESLSSQLPLMNRLVQKTQIALEDGAQGESEAERFLAYVEPFAHVMKYPSFFVAGTGVTNRRWGGNVYLEATMATHSAPSLSYYAYGVGGAASQIGLMVVAFLLIYRRLQQAKQKLPQMTWIWRALLAAWCGLLPWWAFGHGIVSAPHGAMVFFFYLGIVLACERIYMKTIMAPKTGQVNKL